MIFFKSTKWIYLSCAKTAGGRALLYCTVLGATRRTVRKKYSKNILRLLFGANTQKVSTFIHSQAKILIHKNTCVFVQICMNLKLSWFRVDAAQPSLSNEFFKVVICFYRNCKINLFKLPMFYLSILPNVFVQGVVGPS